MAFGERDRARSTRGVTHVSLEARGLMQDAAPDLLLAAASTAPQQAFFGWSLLSSVQSEDLQAG